MRSPYVIHAEFHPNGAIVPISITNLQGHTTWIDVSKMVTDLNDLNNKTERFHCKSRKGEFTLLLKGNEWEYKDGLQ